MFDANRPLVEGVTHEWARRTGWAAREWSPVVGAEHLATRERAALFDITPYVKIRVEGPGALAFLERICANRIDRPSAPSSTPRCSRRAAGSAAT